MKNKILILFSILSLLVLLALEGHLLLNTYKLEIKSYKNDAVRHIFKIYNQSYTDSIYWLYRDNLKSNIKTYYQKEQSIGDLFRNFSNNNKSLNSKFNSFIGSELAELTEHQIQIKVSLKELLLYRSASRTDTLFSELNGKTNLILGHNFNNKEGTIINTSVWKDHLSTEQQYPYFNSKTTIYINTPNLTSDVLSGMLWIFIVSLIIFVFVVLLFYYSISNLIKQKKNSEIKTDFINNITHEFNTPLSTIQISTKMLLNDKVINNPKAIKSTVETIERQNKRLQSLLDQVLSRSLSKGGQITMRKEETLISEYISNIINDYKLTIADKNIDIFNSITPSTDIVKIDKFYFSVVLLNILNNAVKYKGTHIEVIFKFNHKKNYFELIVSDNGIGIDKTDKAMVFEQFYRVSENLKHNYKGLGLGLFYSQEIVKMHGGSISLVSDLGIGSSFIVKVPIK